MKKINTLSLFYAFSLFFMGCSSFSKNSCSWGTKDGTKKIEVPKEDGTGTETFSEILQSCTNNSGGHTYYNVGYKDSNGKVIVTPQQFSKVDFLSNRRALVSLSFEKGLFGLYTFSGDNQGLVELGKMYVRELQSLTVVGKNSPRVFAGVTVSDAKAQTYDVTLFTSYMQQHKTLKNLGGKSILRGYSNERDIIFKFMRRYGDHIIIDSTDPQTGQRQSQFLALDGSPVTPQIGYVSQYFYSTKDRELMTQIGTFKDLNLPTEHGLLWPISMSGELLSLPTGAVGIFPMFNFGGAQAAGWMVLYQGSQGLEMEPHVGRVSDMPKVLSTTKRYTGLVFQGRRDNQGTYVARKMDGTWVIFDETKLEEYSIPGSPASMPTMNGMYQAYVNYNAKLSAQYDAERKAREVAYQARQQKYLQEKRNLAIQNLQSGDICNYLDSAIEAGDSYIQEYVSRCKITHQYQLDKLTRTNVDRKFLENKSSEILQQRARDHYSAQMAEVNYQNALKAWSTVGPLNIANPGAPSAQQQRYQMEKQINQQIWNKNWDPYKK